MKMRPIFIAVAAIFSASAIAGGQSSQGASQGPDMKEQSAQSTQQPQQQAQNPELVKQAQEKLSAAGHDAGTPDGKVGPKTQAAVKEFQESKGLQASGKLDQETLAALEIGTPEGTTSSSAGSSSPSKSEKQAEQPKPQ